MYTSKKSYRFIKKMNYDYIRKVLYKRQITKIKLQNNFIYLDILHLDILHLRNSTSKTDFQVD